MRNKISVAVLGCGNMGTAIVEGAASTDSSFIFHTYTPTGIKAARLAAKVGGLQCLSLADIPESDLYLIACKPDQFAGLAKDLREFLPKKAVVVSVMASVSIQTIRNFLGKDCSIARVMPNTPSSIGEGLSALCFSADIRAKQRKSVLRLLNGISKVVELDSEETLDRVTAISGSGPAYLFEIADILTKKLISMGVPEQFCSPIVRQMLYGSSRLLLGSELSACDLRDQVTTSGGITHAALQNMKSNGLQQIFSRGIDAAYLRTLEMSK